MGVMLTPTAPTQEKSVMPVNVNVRMDGRYMTESASQVGLTHYRVPYFCGTVNYRMVGSYMTDSAP